MLCAHCGKELPDDTRLCEHCGAEIAAETPESTPTEAPDTQAAAPPAGKETADAAAPKATDAPAGEPVAVSDAPPSELPAPVKSRGKLIVSSVFSLVLLAAIGAAIFFFYQRNFNMPFEAMAPQDTAMVAVVDGHWAWTTAKSMRETSTIAEELKKLKTDYDLSPEEQIVPWLGKVAISIDKADAKTGPHLHLLRADPRQGRLQAQPGGAGSQLQEDRREEQGDHDRRRLPGRQDQTPDHQAGLRPGREDRGRLSRRLAAHQPGRTARSKKSSMSTKARRRRSRRTPGGRAPSSTSPAPRW